MRNALVLAVAGCCLLPLNCGCGVEAPRAFAEMNRPVRGGVAPTRSASEAYLREQVDGAFNRNDLDGLYATLTPIHRRLYQRLVDRFAYAMQIDSLTMKSRLVNYRTEADSAILLVESTFHSKVSRTLDVHREWSYLVLHDHSEAGSSTPAVAAQARSQTGSGTEDLRTLIQVTVDPAHLPYKDNLRAKDHSWNEFRCGHCNYSLTAPDGWLMVPQRSAYVGCVEAVSFHSLSSDVSVDVSVHVGEPDADVDAVLGQLLRHRRKGRSIPGIQRWLPAAYVQPQEGMRGAVATVITEGEEGGDIERVHLVCHGPMQYLMVSHAPVGSLSEEGLRLASGAVIDSFMIQNLKLSAEDLLQGVRKHSRSRMDGPDLSFEHPEIGKLSFSLPEGWTGSLKTNHFLIDMACDCPNEANHIKLQGAEPPVGHESWTTAAADEILKRTLESFDAEVISDSGWQAQAGADSAAANQGSSWDHNRTLSLNKPIAAGRNAEVDLYLMMTNRILVALQTTTEDDMVRPLMRASVKSLRFER